MTFSSLLRRRSPRSRLLLFLPVFLCLTVAAIGAARAQQAAAPTGRVVLPGSFNAVAPTGKATADVQAEIARPDLTSDEAAETMQVSLALRMRNYAELERRVAAGELISRAEMEKRFLPDAADYAAVAQWASAQGLTVEPAGASRAAVIVNGTPAQLEKAFQTRFGRVRFKGEEYTAATEAPSLPADIQARVRSVHGLQPYLRPHKHLLKKDAHASGTVPYYVGDILNAYQAAASGLTGAGQTIAIIIDTLPLTSDLTDFWSQNQVSQILANYSTVNVRNRTIGPPTGEETLDAEWSSGLASGAQVVIYACGDLNYVNQAYTRVLDDLQAGAQPNLHQITMSFGAGEVSDETPDDINTVHEDFTAITAYGVSIFASSGDAGAYGNGEGKVEVVYPASDPLVTGVGGTTMTLQGKTVISETAWSAPSDTIKSVENAGASGGGISTMFDRPTWQVGTGVPAGTMRLVPDVSLDGDPNTGGIIVLKGKDDVYGGTSWSTPCWAALCAMLNQSRASHGLAPLSGFNSLLYPLLGTAAFRDIVTGNNGPYDAGVGYDLVTGLGVPDFSVLLTDLATAPPPPVPVITSSNQAQTRVGEAFEYDIVATNTPTSYNATSLPTGLSINTVTGAITGTVATAGTYIIEMSATNAGGTYPAALSLTVSKAVVPGVVLRSFANGDYASGQDAEFAFYLTEPTTVDLTISYTLSGTAVAGRDYKRMRGYVIIPAGDTDRILKIPLTGKPTTNPTHVLLMTLAPDPSYRINTTRAERVTITND